MEKPTRKTAEQMPKRKRERQAFALLQSVRSAFEDPKTAEEFKQWQKAREQKGVPAHA